MKRLLSLFCLLLLAGCHNAGDPVSSSAQTADNPASLPDSSSLSPPESQAGFQSSDSSFENSLAASNQEKTSMNPSNAEAPKDASGVEIRDGLAYKDGILIINKKYGVPKDYAPGVNEEANEKAQQLIAAMQQNGLAVGQTTSNFRDYDYQASLYNNYVNAYGQQAADTFSARPGFSEHQSGLAFDLTDPSGQLLTSKKEAAWLRDNAWQYGFIVRYPEGKEAITGYQPEPWHVRYIGERAREIKDSGLTLEEFLGVEGGDYAS